MITGPRWAAFCDVTGCSISMTVRAPSLEEALGEIVETGWNGDEGLVCPSCRENGRLANEGIQMNPETELAAAEVDDAIPQMEIGAGVEVGPSLLLGRGDRPVSKPGDDFLPARLHRAGREQASAERAYAWFHSEVERLTEELAVAKDARRQAGERVVAKTSLAEDIESELKRLGEPSRPLREGEKR